MTKMHKRIAQNKTASDKYSTHIYSHTNGPVEVYISSDIAISVAILHTFSKFFHCQNQIWNICVIFSLNYLY